MIEVKNLVKRYGSKAAVDDISFTLENGKVYGFLGPNGAGKSTTMNIMTGYLASTSGEVIIDGYDILSDPEEAKKSIGYLPEIPPLYTDMTVQEYLKFAAEIKKVPRGERKSSVDSVMEMTGLTEYKKRLISNLSKGYRQRVGLAQAILGNPDIIILDEPTVGLDPRQIIEIRELIKKLSLNHTIILSSHILSEISAVCDQIMIIVRGHLIANATPAELLEMYSNGANLELKVRGSIDEIRGCLQRVEGIAEMSVVVDMVDRQLVDVSIVEDNKDIREAVFHALAESGLPIYEMHKDEPTLEDIFLKLSNEEEARYAAAMEAEEQEKLKRKLGGRKKDNKENIADTVEEDTEGEEEEDGSDN